MGVQFFKKIAIFALFFCFSNKIVFSQAAGQPPVDPSVLPPTAVVPTGTGIAIVGGPPAATPPRGSGTGVGSPDQPNQKVTPATALSPHPDTKPIHAKCLVYGGPSCSAACSSGGAGGSAAGSGATVLPKLAEDTQQVIIELQSLFFDEKRTYSPADFNLAVDARVISLGALVVDCLKARDVRSAATIYVNLMDFCRCLLYGRRMPYERYMIRLDRLSDLRTMLANLFTLINDIVNTYLAQPMLSLIDRDLFLYIYDYAERKRDFLLLGRSQPDVQFTVYAECFVDFLKMIKRIENYLNRNHIVVPGRSFNVFNEVTVVSDEHVNYVETGGGGHRFHINSYPLLEPLRRLPGASVDVVRQPVECMSDDSGVVAVNWPMDSGGGKQSTLFPRCYDKMFFVYLQRLHDVLEGRPLTGINVLGCCTYEDNVSGRVYFQHAHRVDFECAAGFSVCSCGLKTEPCSVFGAAIPPRPHIIIWGWRTELLEEWRPGSTVNGPEDFVRIVSTIFPTIYVNWSERATSVVRNLSTTPAQSINMQDLFLSAMRGWLVSRDACELVWDRVLGDVEADVERGLIGLSTKKNLFLAGDASPERRAIFFQTEKRTIGRNKSLQGMEKTLAIKQCDVLLTMLNDPFASSMPVQVFLRTFQVQILACARNKIMQGQMAPIVATNRIINTYLQSRSLELQENSLGFFEFTSGMPLLDGVRRATRFADIQNVCAMNLLDSIKECVANPTGVAAPLGAISDGPVTVLLDHSRLILNSEILGAPLPSGIAVIIPEGVFLRLL